jgi:ribosomal protein L11 methyltransferase
LSTRGHETATRYPFVAIDVPAALAEVAAEQLFELGAEGVEQRDTTTLVRGRESSQGPVADPGADVASARAPEAGEHEVVTLVAAFANHEAALEALAALGPDLSPRLEEVVGDEWRDAWKEHFEPFRLSPHIVVRPPWREAPATLVDESPGTHVLELEPGRAFGTGLHASTALVVGVIDARRAELADAEILDVGCGSGILSLSALALGARRARAVDLDEDAVRITLENAARAGVEARVEADAMPIERVGGRYRLVLANIQAEVLVPLAGALMARVAEHGLLVLSGVLVEQGERVRDAYARFTLEDSKTSGEWIALVLRAP